MHNIKKILQLSKPNLGSISYITLLKVITAMSSVAIAVSSKQIIDLAISRDLKSAGLGVLIFVLLISLQIGVDALLTLTTTRTSEMMSYRLQSEFLDRLYKINWITLNSYHSGDLLTRLTSDIKAVVNACVNLFPNIIALFVQLLTAFFTLFYMDKGLAIFAFALGPFTGLFSFFIGQKIKNVQHRIQKTESSYRSYINEILQNFLIVKTFENEASSLNSIDHYQNNKYSLIMQKNRISVHANIFLGIGYRIGYFAAFGWGALKLARGTSTLGTFTAFLQLVGQVQGPMEDLALSVPDIVSTIASVERLMEFEALEYEDHKDENAMTIFSDVGLSMNQVSFSYEKNTPIIIDASFVIHSGEIAALIGVSGEGKTTLIRLLLALLKPSSGHLYLNQKDSQISISASTRSYFSYVPQGNTLFSGSILENLKIGSPEANDSEIKDALLAASAWTFVQELENGINTIIGENGIGLSEGQAQRLSIARALLRKSSILILDEATSALDMETEKIVLANIKKQNSKRACIVITHRSSAFSICDSVYRLSKGILSKEDINEVDGNEKV